jgi:methionyl-tRNA formyltransferase
VRIVFVGVHREAEAPLRHLLSGPFRPAGVVTLDPVARQKVSGGIDLGVPARQAGVPVFLTRNVNDAPCVDWIRRIAPDVLLVVGWTQLVREELLRVPKVALGFHASLLPRYRGRAPINWALIHDERETGNTMIVLEPGADEGDIIAQRAIPIADGDDCATLYDKVAATEIEMLAEVLPLIEAGRMPRRRQDAALATVMPKRRPEDGLIDWSKSTRALYNWVRALTHPYPGAFTFLGGARVFVWKTMMAAGGGVAPPGTVRARSGAHPLAATGDGWLELVSVQREGEAEGPGAAAASTWLRDGSVLR